MATYENHVYESSDFPIIFHLDTLSAFAGDEWAHWHENIELLFFIEGKANVALNNDIITAEAGQLVVINSATLHRIQAQDSTCKYYCLITDKMLLMQRLPFMSEQVNYNTIINDTELEKYFMLIVNEMHEKAENYKFAVKELVILFFCLLGRRYLLNENFNDLKISQNTGKKIELVKSVISFIRENYSEDISINEVCNHVGFSVSYMCHVFKEVTGKTIVAYINFVRCSGARRLIKTGRYNISESATLCGFNSLPYFSRTYKEIFGTTPSIST